MNLCRAHNSGYATACHNRASGHAERQDDGCACQLLEWEPLRWVASEAPAANNGRLVNVHGCHQPGSQAAPGCIARRPACVERSMASDPDRHRVVPTQGGDSKNGRARWPRQPSPGTCAQRRSPSSSRCHQRRSAAGRRRACCPTSAPWAATDATPTPRSGLCWKPCPSHPRPARGCLTALL